MLLMRNNTQHQLEAADSKVGGLVAVAIDKDKTSQYAIKWAVDNILCKGQSVTLVHVKVKQSSIPTPGIGGAVDVKHNDHVSREVFLPFRCFCSRKDIKCIELILEDTDITKALTEYINENAIETMVVGASTRNGLVRRFRGPDIATNITKSAADFCTVYVISKGKVLSSRPATRAAPKVSSLTPSQNQPLPNAANLNDGRAMYGTPGNSTTGEKPSFTGNRYSEESEMIRSPFTRGRAANGKSYGELSMPESDISFVSSGRPSTERMSIDRVSFEAMDYTQPPRFSNGSDCDRISFGSDRRSIDDRRSFDDRMSLNSFGEYSNCSGFSSSSSMNSDDVESEMRRLRLELKQTMDMYNNACREALNAKQKANDLQKSKVEENQRLEEARLSKEAALAMAEKEKLKCRAALDAAEAAQKIAELEAHKRVRVERKTLKDTDERNKTMHNDGRYRRYSIEEIEIATDYFSEKLKIGEGGYGPVYKSTLDHTSVAIKVLRPDAAQGESQFQQEVEILSCIRHPNMVLLLGACPEYGCLVYEYMSNGSLEDCLSRKGNTPALPWQLRFRIAAEIGTALLFLHQAKPEPLVHRDLKPANILIDRNFVSKISDVGLARLVPPSVADTVTQYRMTQTAGTFCYIDPEYQQTGQLGTKSDVYSLGIMFLQLITAKPAMGLTHHVQRAIEKGTFREMLDPAIQDWPYEEVLRFAKLSLKCAELRKRDRPDLGTVVLPELERLSQFAEDNMPNIFSVPYSSPPQRASQSSSFSPDIISANHSTSSSARSRSSFASMAGAA